MAGRSASTNIHVFPLTLTPEDAQDQLQREVWPVIKPEWDKYKVNSTVMPGGYVNSMTVYHVQEPLTQDALVVRIFGNKGGDYVPRDTEFIHMQIAAHVGCGPTVRASFKNGVIYDYVPGRPLGAADMRDPNIIRVASRKLADLHWCDLSAVPLIDMKGAEVEFELENEHFTQTRLCLDLLPERVRREKAEYLVELESEIEYTSAILEELDFPVANTHEDFHPSNILYDESSGDVNIVDYEFGCKGDYAVLDLAYIFCLYQYAVFAGKIDLPTEPETEETKRLWLTAYLRRMYELQGKEPADVGQTEVAKWLLAIDMMEILVYPYSAGRVLQWIESGMELAATAILEHCRKLYYEKKPRLPGLCEKYRQLKSQQ